MALIAPGVLREAILQNKALSIGNGGQGVPGAPGPPGVPSFAAPHISVSGNYTANVNTPLILASGTITVTLPAATGTGATFWIKNIGVGVITIDAGAGKFIDGAQTAVLNSQYEAIQIFDSALNTWYVF